MIVVSQLCPFAKTCSRKLEKPAALTSSFSGATKVPFPCTRYKSPSRTSSVITERTVIRLNPYCWASSFSEGILWFGPHVLLFNCSRIIWFNWSCSDIALFLSNIYFSIRPLSLKVIEPEFAPSGFMISAKPSPGIRAPDIPLAAAKRSPLDSILTDKKENLFAREYSDFLY